MMFQSNKGPLSLAITLLWFMPLILPHVCFVPTANLPELLLFNNGTKVTTETQWNERREELFTLLDSHVLGTAPLDHPDLVNSTIVNSTKGIDVVTQFILLDFQIESKKNCEFFVEILRPLNEMKYPAFLTQWNHREWANAAVRRRYMGIVYPAADTRDSTDCFSLAYPKYSWGLIRRRAFLASLVLDYLYTRNDVDTNSISITGHSRNGKQSLVAAAYDSRFTSVVGSSPGAPIASPYRFTSRQFFGENPLDSLHHKWWLESLAKYAGKENEIPIDGHAVLALIAPRRCMIASGKQDHESDITFANEMSVRAVMEVYNLYDSNENLRVLHRDGDHHGFIDIDSYIDWFSGGIEIPLVYLTSAGFSWDKWNRTAVFDRTPPLSTDPLRDRINWLIGDDSPSPFSIPSEYNEESVDFPYVSSMMRRDQFDHMWAGVKRISFAFGGYASGNIYYFGDKRGKTVPAVVWIHPYSYATGHVPSYGMDLTSDIYHSLAAEGYVVLAFDQIGFGLRIDEGISFYERNGGNSSRFGHMLKDVHGAIDVLYCLSEKGRMNSSCNTGSYPSDYFNQIPLVDTDSITLIGYAMGGNIALHAAALDDRISGVAAFSGFTPMRTDSNTSPTGGIQRLYSWHGLLPRLGLFQAQLSSIPYDHDELISSIAPRHLLLYSQKYDRDANHSDVTSTASIVSKEYERLGVSENFIFEDPMEYSEFSAAQIQRAVKWMKNTFPVS